MFDKFLKNMPVSNYYVGYRVRKDTILKTDTDSQGIRSDAFIHTYLSSLLFLYTKDGEKYHDVKLKKSVNEVNVDELCSLHLDYGNKYLKRSDYDDYSKNDLYGVYGITNLEEVIKAINDGDSLVDKPVFKYDEKLGITMMEADLFLKSINKYLGGNADSIECPMIAKDELDDFKCDFMTKQEFLNVVGGKNPLQVKGILKQLKDVN